MDAVQAQQSIDGLTETLRQIDDREVSSTDTQRAYVAGSLAALEWVLAH